MEENLNMNKALEIPVVDNLLQYYVDGKFIGRVDNDQVYFIRLNVCKYIDETGDKSILDKFYFIGHEDSNVTPGKEIKITIDENGEFSDFPWEMNHYRRSMWQLLRIKKIVKERIK